MLQYSPSLLSVLQWLTALSPEDSAAPTVFSGEAHSVFPLFLLPYHCGFQSISLSSFKNPRSDETHDFHYISSTVQQSPALSSTFIKSFSAQLSPFLQLLPCHCFIPRSHSTAQSICAYASLAPPLSSVCLSHFFFLLPKPVSPSDFSPQYIVPLSTITMSKNLGVILDSFSCSVHMPVLLVLPANIPKHIYFSPSSYHPLNQTTVPSPLNCPQ